MRFSFLFWTVLALIGVGLTVTPALAQEDPAGDDDTLSADEESAPSVFGQVRSRLEFNDFNEPHVALRSVLGVTWSGDDWGALAEVRDVRLYGDNFPGSPPQVNSSTTDFFQGYAQGQISDGLWLRAGRQALSYDDERIIGAFDWAHEGRSFDMIMFRYMIDGDRPGLTDMAPTSSVDVFWTPLQNDAVFASVGPVHFIEAQMFGIHANFNVSDFNLSAFLYSLDMDAAFTGAQSFVMHTFGVYATGTAGELTWNFTAAAQAGTLEDDGSDNETETFGSLVHVGLKYQLSGDSAVGAKANYGSGDRSDSGQFDAWQPLFPTAHKFHGYMDREDGSNVTSASIYIEHSLEEQEIDLSFAVWSFWVNERDLGTFVDGIGTINSNQSASAWKALEFDLQAKHDFSKHAKLLVGVIGWIPGRLGRDNGAGNDLRVYIQLTLTFGG